MTLIEVLGGLFLLSTLLVAILSAHRRQVTQIRRSESVHDVIDLANNQLADWFANIDETPIPTDATGYLDETAQYRWDTQIIDRSRHRDFGIVTVRYEVVGRTKPTKVGAENANENRLLSVELFVVDPDWVPPQDLEQAGGQ